MTITSKLIGYIEQCGQRKFTGRLVIQDFEDLKWEILFFHGRCTGDRKGVHPYRRWHRQIDKYCPQIDKSLIKEDFTGWNCLDLKDLVTERKLERDESVFFVEGSLEEVVFDILLREVYLDRLGASLDYSLQEESSNVKEEIPVVLVKLEYLLPKPIQAVDRWLASEAGEITPNFAPTINSYEKLQEAVPAGAYNRLSTLVDGDRTLRDLGIQLEKEPFILLASLRGYIDRGLISVAPVPDLQPQVQGSLLRNAHLQVNSNSQRRKIVHVDDSPLDIQLMESILLSAGYEFISIQDPMRALSVAIKHQPEFIFLDLIMPVANGYEICSQFRRVSQFHETPIVILTASDGIVDRVRARMVKATAFVSKPIEEAKILAIIGRYLDRPDSVSLELNPLTS